MLRIITEFRMLFCELLLAAALQAAPDTEEGRELTRHIRSWAVVAEKAQLAAKYPFLFANPF